MSAILQGLAPPPTAWRRPAMALALVWLAIVLLNWSTATSMVGIWSRSDTFAHAFLVPPISLWLAWRGRDRLVQLVPTPSLIWLLPMALAALGWLLGDLVDVNALTHFALVALLVTSVPLVLGWAVTRALLFPLLFLFFCVPVGEFLLPVLMEGTADFTVAALRLSGIPVYREGLQFVIPSGYWSVVEACSGVRYLIASLMVGSLFAYLNYQSLSRRLVFVGVSIVVPIIANWLRAYMIVMLGHLSNNKIATGVDHLVYGWVFFGVVITIMFVIGARWSEPDRALVPPRSPSQLVGYVAPSAGSIVAVALALLLVAAPHALLPVLERNIASTPPQLPLPVPAQDGWLSAPLPTPWLPHFEGASSQQVAGYSRDGRSVSVHVAYYRQQGPGRKLVSSQNVLVSADDKRWHPVGTATKAVEVEGNRVVLRSTDLISSSGGVAASRQHLTVWQVYWVGGHWTGSGVSAKLSAAAQLLAGGGDDGAAVTFFVPEESTAAADALLTSFIQTHLPGLQQALEQARDRR
jgi:exosortase A